MKKNSFQVCPTVFLEILLNRKNSDHIICSYPDSWFCQACPHCNIFSSTHIRISIPSEKCFQLLQLLGCKMGALPSITFSICVIIISVILAANRTRFSFNFRRTHLVDIIFSINTIHMSMACTCIRRVIRATLAAWSCILITSQVMLVQIEASRICIVRKKLY